MTRRRPPPPDCARCGEPCADSAIVDRSITGERVCRACKREEEEDIALHPDEFTIGLGKERTS